MLHRRSTAAIQPGPGEVQSPGHVVSSRVEGTNQVNGSPARLKSWYRRTVHGRCRLPPMHMVAHRYRCHRHCHIRLGPRPCHWRQAGARRWACRSSRPCRGDHCYGRRGGQNCRQRLEAGPSCGCAPHCVSSSPAAASHNHMLRVHAKARIPMVTRSQASKVGGS